MTTNRTTVVKKVFTTSCLKNQLLTKQQKKHLMLKDLHNELQKYSSIKGMELWCDRLRQKIKELYEAL